MFENCINIEKLDLTTFNTINVTNYKNTFEGCKNLTIKVVQSQTKGLIDAKPTYVKIEYA